MNLLMKVILFLIPASLLFLSGIHATPIGHVQVQSEPGLLIFLDGTFRGETTAELGGLVLQGVPEGTHTLKVVKEGFQPQTEQVDVVRGEMVSIRVGALRPQVSIEQVGRSTHSQGVDQTGTLSVESLPTECLITIAELGITEDKKVKGEWRARFIPPGKYRIEASAQGKTLTQDADVLPGRESRVFFDFVAGAAQEVEKELTDWVPRESSFHAGEIWKEPHSAIEFVWVPGGCYEMGCGHWTHACKDDEEPVHKVCVDGFWISKYEVTQAQWQNVIKKKSFSFTRGDTYPADKVSWDDAREFITQLSALSDRTFRLPTEAEWEYAARSGGRPEKYSGGGHAEAVAWHARDSGEKLHPVGTKAPNGLGIHDMSGNVWEWCQDSYDPEFYASSPRINPLASLSSPYRVLRGGSWDDLPKFVRTGIRYKRRAEARYSFMLGEFRNIGLRLVSAPGE